MAIGLTKVSTAEMRTMPKGIGVRARHWMPALRLGWCLPLRCLACVCRSRCGTASLRQTTQNTPRHPSALLQVDNLHYLNDGERGCRGAQQSVGSGSLGSKCCSSGREAFCQVHQRYPPLLSPTTSIPMCRVMAALSVMMSYRPGRGSGKARAVSQPMSPGGFDAREELCTAAWACCGPVRDAQALSFILP